MTETTSLEELAREARGWLERAERPDGSRFTRTRDGAPAWVGELVHDAHGDLLPDDWRYDCVAAALEAIGDDEYDVDDGPAAFADGYVDIYTSALLEWVGSHGSRVGYCDEAAEELGLEHAEPGDDGIVRRLQLGQYMEAREVFELVVQALEGEQSARELEELAGEEG